MTVTCDAADAAAQALFFTPQGRTDPYPLYHQLRDANPVHKIELGWLLTRYDDCWAVLRDPRFGKDYVSQTEAKFGSDWERHPALKQQEKMMINVGGAEHTRLRKLVSKSFTPRTIDRLRPHIEETVVELVGPLAEAGGGNILEAVGFPLPVTIIGEMLGVPRSDREQFRGLVADLVAIFEMDVSAEQLAAADHAQLVVQEYFLGLIAEKRRHPGEDLLSGLIHVAIDGDHLTDLELTTMALLLFAAGFETTTNLFGNGLYALLRNPEQIRKLRADPGLFPNLPEELLRYDGTVQLTNRVAETDVEVAGVTISAGDQVFPIVGAGNHDPAVFEDPDGLDVTRADIRPLTLGGGAHFCLGAALARAETEVTFRTLLSHLESIELDETPHFHDRLTLRGLKSLQVTCRPAATPGLATVSLAAASPPAEAGCPVAHDRGFRPSGEAAADLRWRAEMREKIESAPGAVGAIPQRAGAELSRTVALFARNSLFKRCTVEQLEQLAATAYQMSFEPGDVICSEGEESPEAYMVEEGQAVVTVDRKGVGTVKEDVIVGERGVVLQARRSATVTAVTHMITYAISRQRLRNLIDRDPAVRAWMLEEMKNRYGDQQ
jgi:cytochrome P450/quercetin dioxygenase-like cupin family protein